MNQLSRIFLALTAALLVVTGALVVGPAAVALRALEHAYGFVATTPDHSWLGSHRLDDGNLGFCLNVSKHPPEGNHFLYQRGDSLGWYSSDDSARLADIARTWLPSTDPNWAAGAQLAVWGITGLNGHDAGWYAARAGANAGAVASIATQIRAAVDAPTGASHWVSAGAYLTLGDGSANSVSTELFVDYVGQGVTQLSPGQYTGILSLTGATFDDGSSSREVSNGQSYSITPRDGHPTTDVSAEVNYTALPFGDALWVAQNTDDGQSLLVPPAFLSSAHASARGTAASPLPFAPAVSTETSSQLAVPGAAVHDTLHLTLASTSRGTPSASSAQAAPQPGSAPVASGEQLTEWGTYESPDGTRKPIPVTVTSSLLGPFDTAPVEAVAAPPGAPVVCTVNTVAADGPGTYVTPACILPVPGYYAWVDSIDPRVTPPEQGGARILPWASPFGTAAEVSRVPAPAGTAPPTTAPPTPDATPSSPPPSSPAPPPTPSSPATPSAAPPSPTPTITPLHGGEQPGGSGPARTLPSTGLTAPALPLIVAVSGAMVVGGALYVITRLKRGQLRVGRRAGRKPPART